MKTKIKDLITVFLIQLVLTIPFYTASVYGLTISNVQVTKVTSSSATIEWDTDNISNGEISYGQTTALNFTQRHTNYILNHTLNLFNGIVSDTTYFFVVESTDLSGNTAVDNNSNNFYTFKTTDITPPPQVIGLRVISVTSSSIFLTWDIVNVNDLSHYIILRNRVPISNATTNSFNDTNLSSDTEFNYKVSAVDTSNNEGSQSDTVIASTLAIDSTPPIISNVDALQITDTSTKITWLTNENSTSIILYGINQTDKTKSISDLVTNHSIVIDSLTKGSKYTFTVKSCDASNNCANSSNHNFTAGKDVTAPFINLSIPRYVNRRIIDIIGSTEPFTSVTLFVNDMNIPKRSLSNDEVGASGKFVFSQIQLQTDNIIKLVFVDKSGNKNQKTFDVSVDTEDPIVQLNEIPSLTSKTNLTISGNVNEPVTIKVFVDTKVNESAIPSQITGLNATKINQNSVELHWDELRDKDFSHYVVYRDDVAIAITKPADFNFFIDALVDSGKSYTYKVSAVNTLANEGPRSEPITVTTLEGGAILNLKYAPVDVFEDFRKPLLTTNTSGSFNFGIKLNKGDGKYNIKLIADDRANNSVIIEKSVTLDTKKPDVKIISPPSGAFIFENVANEVDVIGRTEPNARVHLFVDRTPFSFFNQTLELSGLPNEVQNIPEAQLDAKCRFNVAAKSFCRTGADFSIDADAQGNFKFERVDLTAIFGGAARLTEVPVTEFRDMGLEEGREAKTTTLVVIATDQTGQRGVATQNIRIGTCWSGNQSWDIIPLAQYQSPTFLSTERFAEGTETIYFYFNYSYIGRGTIPVITSVSISKACSTKELLDPRFNISCQVLPSSVPTKPLNPPENTVSYSAATLSTFPGMDRFLENEWKSFLKAINKELSFPLKVRITYKHDTDNDGELETETQTTCEQVSYVVDNSIIDPRKILPDWLLFDAVDFLQDSIKTLAEVQEQINKVVEYVAVGCISSFVLTFVVQIYRRWVTFWEEKVFVIQNAAKLDEALASFKLPNEPQNEDTCKDIIKKIKEKKGSFQMKYMTDADLRRCFPSSASAWDREANVYQFFRYSCDRIFGHSAPAKWTESKTDTQLYNKISSGEGCAVDQSVIGQYLRAESCTELARRTNYKRAADFGADAKCTIKKTSQKGEEAVYTIINTPVSGSEKLYQLKYIDGLRGINEYAIKRDDFNYLTAQTKSCAEICGVKDPKQFTGPGNKKFTVSKERPKTLQAKKPGTDALAGCATADTCKTVLANKKVFVTDEKGVTKEEDVTSAETRGYTSDCFYDPETDTPSVVSDSPATREECCCINAKEAPPSQYYQPEDKAIYDINKYAHDSKTLNPLEQGYKGPEGYADMKWSYRYWKERFEAQTISEGFSNPTSVADILRKEKVIETSIHTEYNPYRYISGRDLPACFGQNYWFYEAFKPETALMLNPSRDYFLGTLQCVHLAGISNRIQFIRNLMQSFSNCLISVRTTGRGDAGACKELFTQYLCNSIWQGIRWFVDGCIPIGYGVDTNEPYPPLRDVITSVKAFASAVSGSVSDLQAQTAQEYGNAKLNELLGTGEESIARKICLFAFGYDWEFNLRNLVDAAYTTPFATLVQAITKSREFLTVDPVSFKPKYEYRASWIINPGCDFERYDVYLSCVGRKQLDQYPNSVNCGALGAPSIAYTGTIPGTGPALAYSQCDCSNLPDEKPGPLVFAGRLKQNVLEDKPAFHKVIEDNVRYDHLKFVLRPDRKISSNIKPNCFPQGYDDGVFYFPLIDKSPREIFDCRVDYLSGSFICGGGATFATRKGIAYFENVVVNGVDTSRTREPVVVGAGDRLNIEATVRKLGQDKCIRATLDGVVVDTVGAAINGSYTYYLTTPPISTGQKEQIEGDKQGLEFKDLELNNQKDVTVYVKFFDISGDDVINFFSDEDKVSVFDTNPNNAQPVTTATFKKDGAEARYKDGAIEIEKEGVKLKIVSATIQKTLDGKPLHTEPKIDDKEKVPFVGGTIVVRKPGTTTVTPQSTKKTLVLTLYHLKGDVDSYNNPENCNPNDAVIYPDKPQKREIHFTIESKLLKESASPGPFIEYARAEPSKVKKDDTVTISVKFANPNEVLTAQYDYTTPDGISNTLPLENQQGIFKALITTDDAVYAGQYKGDIIAKSKNPNTNPSKREVKFEVQCGDENNYGSCKKGACCRTDACEPKDEITAGLQCGYPAVGP